MIKIGLTGGIACGKSTVANMFDNLGIPVIDSDVIARNLLDINTEAYFEVVERFGPEIVLPSKHINRKKLGETIFKDNTKRELLNSILHPRVRIEINRQIDLHKIHGEKYVVIDIPLLYESKLESLVDFIIVVSLPEDVQLQRLIERDGITEEQGVRKIRSQMPISEKEKLADEIIDNSKTILESKKQLLEILRNRDIVL